MFFSLNLPFACTVSSTTSGALLPVPCEVVEALGGPKIDVATGRKDALEEDAENRLPDGSLIWNYAITTQVSIIENSVPHTGAMRAKLLAPLKWKKKTH